MNKTYARLILCVALLFIITLALPAQRSRASDGVTFRITIGGAFLRANPSFIAATTMPVFSNQTYLVVGHTADRQWVQLDGDQSGSGGWILSTFGSIRGDLLSLPSVKFTDTITKASVPAVQPKWVPTITAHMRQLYLQSARLGKYPSMFTVIGDCNSESTAYLGRVAAGTFQLPKGQEYLQASMSRFSAAFPRWSLATHGSFGTSAMFDSTWADPSQCIGDEGPLACELRVSKASIAFIALGTGDQYEWQDFAANYRAVIDFTLKAGVLPVLVTKADNLETHSGAITGYINGVIRQLGKEYGLPVMDFWAATRSLPGYGLRNEGNDNFHMTPAGSDTRILATLQTLDAITRR